MASRIQALFPALKALFPALKALSLALIALTICSVANADEKRREELALEVMTLTGMPEIGSQVAAGLIAQLKPAFPDVPDELWVEVAGTVSADEIVRLSIPPYVKHFSEDELVALVEFYKSPLGRTLMQKMPLVAHETMIIGNEWGQRKAREIADKLRSAGHEPKGQ